MVTRGVLWNPLTWFRRSSIVQELTSKFEEDLIQKLTFARKEVVRLEQELMSGLAEEILILEERYRTARRRVDDPPLVDIILVAEYAPDGEAVCAAQNLYSFCLAEGEKVYTPRRILLDAKDIDAMSAPAEAGRDILVGFWGEHFNATMREFLEPAMGEQMSRSNIARAAFRHIRARLIKKEPESRYDFATKFSNSRFAIEYFRRKRPEILQQWSSSLHDFIFNLTNDERQLIVLREEQYAGSWDVMLRKLSNKKAMAEIGGNVIYAAVNKMIEKEKESGIDCAEFLEDIIGMH